MTDRKSSKPNLSALSYLALAGCLLSHVSGCGLVQLPVVTEECKIHTYIEARLEDYLSSQYGTQKVVRMAIMPFDVPETFAPPGNDSVHYGRELARKFQAELARTGKVTIVELFNRDRWPGKRAEFFVDNSGAIELARNAGYDLVVVGYMEELKDDSSINLYTKIIDTANRVSLWNAKTEARTNARQARNALARLRLDKDRPELFDFPVKTELLAHCTVQRITADDEIH